MLNCVEQGEPMEDLTGKQLGPYQIISPLGEGGMAAVFKAFQPGMDRYVALKILPRHFASDPQFVGRFKQEAKVLAQLQHPHVLPVFDFGDAEGFTYIVMPLVESGTLTSVATGREYVFKQPFVQIVGPIPRLDGLREGMEVGFDLGWTSRGIRVTLIRVFD